MRMRFGPMLLIISTAGVTGACTVPQQNAAAPASTTADNTVAPVDNSATNTTNTAAPDGTTPPQ